MQFTNEFSPLKLNLDMTLDTFRGRSVMITGGTGSFGQMMTTTLLTHTNVSSIIIFSRDEFKQHSMRPKFRDSRVKFVIGDVRNYDRIYDTLLLHNVDIVIHTAAIKHVDFAEQNPSECIATNITGTENVVRACVRAKVSKVLALSTDKCVDPVNIYGASKLCLERLVVTGNNFDEMIPYYRKYLDFDRRTSQSSEGSEEKCPEVPYSKNTIFAVARYGNVLGSRGSVVHVFNEQIKSDCISITSSEMTRFTLLKEQAVAFALNCLNIMIGGEVFVPILPTYSIGQLVRVMSPRKNFPTRVIGVRAGEKTDECMISIHESHLVTKINTVQFNDVGEEAHPPTEGMYIVSHHFFGKDIDYEQIYRRSVVKLLDQSLLTDISHPRDFSYTSDNIHNVISDEDLKKMVKHVLTQEV